jgi:hypothetical protein
MQDNDPLCCIVLIFSLECHPPAHCSLVFNSHALPLHTSRLKKPLLPHHLNKIHPFGTLMSLHVPPSTVIFGNAPSTSCTARLTTGALQNPHRFLLLYFPCANSVALRFIRAAPPNATSSDVDPFQPGDKNQTLNLPLLSMNPIISLLVNF